MSSLALVLVVAAITVGSRVLALAVLPEPRGVLAAIVARLPAPLFAAMAAVSLTGSDRAGEAPMLTGLAAALLVVRRRSLLLTVVAGLVGFVVGEAVA